MGKNLTSPNYCVLIPTYNNDKTLENVILSVLEYTKNVIVVNDGSTDNTERILERYRDKIAIVSYPKNQGKGAALRRGFKKAEALGYEYAITLDADGQHLASEIPKFLEKVQPGQDILIIGNRDMSHENIPAKSKFGRKFSNFWVKLETNRDIMDTQSGYRLYTVAKVNRFHFFTKRYDFELESLVRWLWRDYPVEIISIGVYYPPPEERVSHFNGFKDNVRISLLNIVLVLVTVSYIIPRRFIRFVADTFKKALRFAMLLTM
ncbi:MAG TPA: glycosyltransferase family 2 protein [Bacillota bacterium]|nr:glycosyltransferase family 2 protein [Bacillota bacterium]